VSESPWSTVWIAVFATFVIIVPTLVAPIAWRIEGWLHRKMEQRWGGRPTAR